MVLSSYLVATVAQQVFQGDTHCACPPDLDRHTPYTSHLLPCWCALLVSLQTGLQEKATFLQAFGKKGVYSSFIRLPAVAELLLLATVLLVLWQYAAPSASSTRRHQVQYSPVSTDTHV